MFIKNLRTILILILAMGLLVSCGGDEVEEAADDTTTAGEVADTTEEVADTTEEVAAEPDEPEMDAISQIEITEPITLEFWHTKTRSQQELLDEIVADFNNSNEWGITVVPTSIEGSYDQIFKETVAGLAVGEVPDLVVAYPSMVAEYMEADAPLALDAYIESIRFDGRGA
jgi:ABC-type glycerol-3-phosphate transport system substrate-binding protein